MSSFTLKVHNRNLPAANRATSSPYPLTLSFSSEPTVLEVKKAIQAQVPKLYPDRQRITTEDKKPLLDDRAKSGVKNGDDLYVKDLGPQIGWRTVFLIEYFGPIFIHPLFFMASQKYYGAYEYSDMQIVAIGLAVAHYLKREYETVFVHRFSSGTMPLFNVFKNSAHYWILSGVFLAASIYRPAYGAKALKGSIQTDAVYLTSCAVVWSLSELANFQCHVILRNLRSEGGRERKIPRGFAFELVVSLKHAVQAFDTRLQRRY